MQLEERTEKSGSSGLADVKAISAGVFHTCALTTSGAVWCWGENGEGQAGGNHPGQPGINITPYPISDLDSGIKAISAGTSHTCALTVDGVAWCLGWNLYGQLGDGTDMDRFTPVQVVGLDGGSGTETSYFENTNDYAISDYSSVESPITVSGRSGNAGTITVNVRIIHTFRGDLEVILIGPNGTNYFLHGREGSSEDNIIGTYSIEADYEPANGIWKLWVYDGAAGDIGYIDSWSIQF